MKPETLPDVLVDWQLRADLDAALQDGETVEQFVEAAVRRDVESRLAQNDFLARGEAAWLDYRHTGVGRPIDDVMSELRAMTASRQAKLDRT